MREINPEISCEYRLLFSGKGSFSSSLLANGLSTKAFVDALKDTKSGYYQGISEY